ncbi:hypothetical protein BO94DRAFT_619318 [Aspergillus sclerotioniger CBS 115572]|uniref:Zn(2)-C6 fungal-type domain-containing protein n=1 Tax=Aspergillus sclerotioniger CBS 115572 TaxID=1450535 RepID=A0A317XEP1_9EURO|nr:hypothetical protein BO94DRAFT_619318 [Aspergillus sclerotioniger CBS 115572]PWY96137.1 hypothetical protein BO94DRAFT_619318 [Aspergillus sclerotioniger CBS 115572]
MPPKRVARLSTGTQKLTKSCSRCRASKLKCDRKEPCIECLKRDIGHLCTKDERQPRAKRAKVTPSVDGSDSQVQIADPGVNRSTSQPKDSEAEETVQILENYVDDASLERTSCVVAPDLPNPYWSNPRQVDQVSLLREIIDSVPEIDIIFLLHDVFLTRCQAPLGNVVHTPTFAKQVERFCDCLRLPLEERVMALLDKMSMEMISCHLMALVLGLAFHPAPTILGWSATPLTLRVEELRGSDVHAKAWRSLALRCLQGHVSLFCGSVAGLQAAVMLLLDGHGDPSTLDVILATAIAGARRLGLHLLGDAKLAAASIIGPESTEPHIRTEIGIRIWWALVMRDWCRGQSLGYYSIHPAQFNTRMPLHINDDDLRLPTEKVDAYGHITERPRSEFTMLSYTLYALELAVLVRESIDIRGPVRQSNPDQMHKHLNKRYEELVVGLPSHFRLGSSIGLNATGPLAAIPVHRWILHQQLWSLFLRLHRGSLSTLGGRMSCQLLAQNIISTHAQIKSRCTLCRSLTTGETQLFNAAAVLVMGLLFSPSDGDCSGSQLARMMSRDKVREAIELLQTSEVDSESPSLTPMAWKTAQRSIHALEALMKLEEEVSGDEDPNADESMFRNGASVSLKSKVMNVLKSLHNPATEPENTNIEPFSFDMTTPFPMDNTGFHETDVLPGLSNDPSCSFWQFLDFDFFPGLTGKDIPPLVTDQQGFGGWMPFSPSSGLAQSSTTGTPGFLDTEQSDLQI